MQHNWFSPHQKLAWAAALTSPLAVSFLSGVAGLLRRVCCSEPGQRAHCGEGFHRHLSLQHSALPPGHAASTHRRHGAGTVTDKQNSPVSQRAGKLILGRGKQTKMLCDSSDHRVQEASGEVPGGRRPRHRRRATRPQFQYVPSEQRLSQQRLFSAGS